MRVTEGMSYQSLLRELSLGQERMQNAQNEVSSGKKVSTPSDDPIAASDIVRLNSESAEAGQYSKNLTFAKAKLQIADTALDGVEQMVERARTLGQLSLNNTTASSSYIAELNGLRDQIISTANTTHAGRFIFGGSVTTTNPYVKDATTGVVTYNGNAGDMPLQVSRNTTLQTQVSGSEIFSGSVDIFSVMSDLATAMQAGDQSAIDAQVKKLEQFSDQVSVARSKIGGYVNTATNVESELSSDGLVRKNELMQAQDADLAQAITELTMSQQQLQATMAVGARISQLTILDYLK
jgi:flagellar hook-associated protein 3 FlgL